MTLSPPHRKKVIEPHKPLGRTPGGDGPTMKHDILARAAHTSRWIISAPTASNHRAQPANSIIPVTLRLSFPLADGVPFGLHHHLHTLPGQVATGLHLAHAAFTWPISF